RLAVEAVTEIDKWFVIDAWGMKLQALAAVSQSPDGADRAMKTALAQVETALADDNYDAALRMLDAAEAALRKGKMGDKNLALIASGRAEVQGFQSAYRAVAAAREKLVQAPADAGANLVVGKHLCLFHGRWDEGLPLLAKAGAAELARLARQD